MAGILKHVASAVVPAAQEFAKVSDRRSHVSRDRLGEVGEFSGAGLDMERRQLGAERQNLGVNTRIDLSFELGLEPLAHLGGALGRH